ncbi:MAG: site-2 protease family protein [Pirellulaceae bacterium]
MNMYDQGLWSLNLGRWSGLRVRLHMFFLLFAAFALYLGWHADGGTPGDYLTMAALSVAVLLASVVLHEIGHLHAATYFGGGMDQIVIGPLGGLAPITAPRQVRHELIAHLAGPLVNLGVCALCVAAVLLSTPSGEAQATAGSVSPWGLLNPLYPQGLLGGRGQLALQCLLLGVWINWVLFLVNLLPAFPFDGARALRAALSQLWRRDGRRQASRMVSRIAQLTALALVVAAACLAAFGEGDDTAVAAVPAWFALALLGIVLFFSAQRDGRTEQQQRSSGEMYQPMDSYFSESSYGRYDALSEGPEEPSPATVTQLREEPGAARLRRQREIEEADDQRVDEILARLHAGGMECLSPDDKALLQRVSVRYRKRHGHRA